MLSVTAGRGRWINNFSVINSTLTRSP